MDADDDPVVRQLRDVAASIDPPPPELGDAARAALSWRRADRELAALTALAELSYDSREDEPELAGVRGDAGPRLLTFEGDDLTVEVEAAATTPGDALRLVGQVVPPQPARVEARHPEGAVVSDADDLGRFRCEGVAAGPVSLRCHVGSGDTARVVVTDWVTL